jgi:hypothetical protein
MKAKFDYTAALATTAMIALLTGAAHAQLAADPATVCTTTTINPAHNNCVMPTATAPGGGSFPGSFLVPGTNTSFAVHGFIELEIVHKLGPYTGTETLNPYSLPLEGNGISAATAQAHAANGGTSFDSNLARPNIQTQTPTAYGLLKT